MMQSPSAPQLHRRAASHSFHSPYALPQTPSPTLPPYSLSLSSSPRQLSPLVFAPPLFPSLSVSSSDCSTTYVLSPMPAPGGSQRCSSSSPLPFSSSRLSSLKQRRVSANKRGSASAASADACSSRSVRLWICIVISLCLTLTVLSVSGVHLPFHSLQASLGSLRPLLALLSPSSLRSASPELLVTTYAYNLSDAAFLPDSIVWMRRDHDGRAVTSVSPSQPHPHHVHTMLSSSPPSSAAACAVRLRLVSLLRPMTPQSLQSDAVTYHTQYTALLSFMRAAHEVVVWVDNAASCVHLTALQDFAGLSCVVLPASCFHPVYQRPTMDCLLSSSSSSSFSASDASYLAYVNGDIVVSPVLAHHVCYLSQVFGRFAAVSRRTDAAVDTASLLSHNLSAFAPAASLHSEYGIDLFVLPLHPSLPLFFPPFLAGVYRWDNDLLASLLLLPSLPTVDLSNRGLLLHSAPSSQPELSSALTDVHNGRKGADWNERIARERGAKWRIGRTGNAGWHLRCQQADEDGDGSDVCMLTRRIPHEDLHLIRRARHGWIVVFHIAAEDDLQAAAHFLCRMAAQRDDAFFITAANASLVDRLPASAAAHLLPAASASAAVYRLLLHAHAVLFLTGSVLYLETPPAALIPLSSSPSSFPFDLSVPATPSRASYPVLLLYPTQWSLYLWRHVAGCEQQDGEPLPACVDEWRSRLVGKLRVKEEEAGVLLMPHGANSSSDGREKGEVVALLVQPESAAPASALQSEKDRRSASWRRWEAAGLLCVEPGSSKCREEEEVVDATHSPLLSHLERHHRGGAAHDASSLPFTLTFSVYSPQPNHTDRLLLFLNSLHALRPHAEEQLHVRIVLPSLPAPVALLSAIVDMQWQDGTIRLVREGKEDEPRAATGAAAAGEEEEEAGGDEGSDSWYHVLMTAQHVMTERTLPLLRALISHYLHESYHPRLLGIALSSPPSASVSPPSSFSCQQRPPTSSFLLFPRHRRAFHSFAASFSNASANCCAALSSALSSSSSALAGINSSSGPSSAFPPQSSLLSSFSVLHGLCFLLPSAPFRPLLHTACRASGGSGGGEEVDTWKLPLLSEIEAQDAWGRAARSAWQLRGRAWQERAACLL